jgi:transcriptional pleiotropic regulator of transition state genes
METKGIIRRIDNLGRLVVPIQMRERLGIRAGELVEVDLDAEEIKIRPVRIRCQICGTYEKLVEQQRIVLCKDCIQKFLEMAEEIEELEK